MVLKRPGSYIAGARGVLSTEMRAFIAFMTEELFVVVMTTQPIRHRESCFLDVTIIGIKP